MQHLPNGCIAGINFREADVLLVVQVNVGEFGELPHAIMNHMMDTCRRAPTLVFKGLYIGKASDGEQRLALDVHPIAGHVVPKDSLPINNVFLNRLMTEWWDRQPESGPRELVSDPALGVVEKPSLRVCTWVDDVPVPLESAGSKFCPGSENQARWTALIKEHKARFGDAPSTAGPLPARADVVVDNPRNSGPDFSLNDGELPDHNKLISLEEFDTEPTDIVLTALMTAGASKKPTVQVDNTGRVFLSTATAGKECFGPCELFGFGKGSFETVPVLELSNFDTGVPFMFLSDLTPIVWVRNGNVKSLVTLCSALCTAVVDDGVPDVGVQNHTLENRKKDDGSNVFHRYTIKPDPAIAFRLRA